MISDFLKLLRNYGSRELLARGRDVPEDTSGWGTSIAWTTLESGKKQASVEEKPLTVIAHLPGCPLCQQLRRSISNTKEITAISSYFVMVLINEEDVPQKKQYYPDDMGYVPRIMFFDHKGRLMGQYINRLGNPTKKFYYPNGWSLYRTMKEVMEDYY